MPRGHVNTVPADLLDAALKLHGHRCPAMPMGLRAGSTALEALGAERARDGQLMALVELGDEHCATCFTDGVQMATGCTFGKGNIRKLDYGKFGLTLIDKKNTRSVRVTPRAEVMLANKQTAFFTEYCTKGHPRPPRCRPRWWRRCWRACPKRPPASCFGWRRPAITPGRTIPMISTPSSAPVAAR